jgi:uncharacterized protein (DUF1778 family)
VQVTVNRVERRALGVGAAAAGESLASFVRRAALDRATRIVTADLGFDEVADAARTRPSHGVTE